MFTDLVTEKMSRLVHKSGEPLSLSYRLVNEDPTTGRVPLVAGRGCGRIRTPRLWCPVDVPFSEGFSVSGEELWREGRSVEPRRIQNESNVLTLPLSF